MDLKPIFDAVLSGKAPEVESGVLAAIEAGVTAEVILQDGLIAAMKEVGQLFEEGEYFVPEMLIAARAMQAGLGHLKPLLVEEGAQSSGVVAIGTVKGDLHDIGKNLVAMMLEGAGMEVIDLGNDVDVEVFMEAVQNGANVVGMSALLTTTMNNMKDVIEALEDIGKREETKVIIGGAPVTQEFADEIGADAFAPDASSAVRKVNELLGIEE